MKCKNCNNDVYVSPKGYQAKICASCLVDAFVDLGVLDSDFCHCGAHLIDGFCPNCRVQRVKGNLTQRTADVVETCADCRLQYTSSCPSLLGQKCQYFQPRR